MIEQRPRRARSSHFRSVRRILKPLRPKLQVARAVLVMSLGYIATFFVPASRNRRVVGWIETRYLDRHSSEVEHLAAKMEAALTSAGEERDWWAEAAVNFRMRLEEDWGRVRGLRRSGWRPRVEIQGLDHLEAGIREGKGVILWRTSMCSSPIAKYALWDAGYPLVHLSHHRHGALLTDGWVSTRVLGRMYLRSEVPLLRERVVIPADGSLDYMRTLIEKLEQNSIVSIFGDISGDTAGRQRVSATVLGKEHLFPTGAPALAHRVGSLLLPLHTMWEDIDQYRVLIKPPISPNAELSRRDFATSAISQFARSLEDAIKISPGSWRDWYGGR